MKQGNRATRTASPQTILTVPPIPLHRNETMPVKPWPKATITINGGETHEAIAPLIISASRSTDIPAFFGPWFMKRLDAGYVKWINPWSGKPQYVSLARARLFVFWSKNPAPFLPYLSELDKRGLSYYFQFTVNDYEAEGLEQGIPPLKDRIETFRRLSGMIGAPRVLWRFDPLIITDALSPAQLAERIGRIARSLRGYTDRLTISFVDFYAKVRRNIKRTGVPVREWDEESRSAVLKSIAELARALKLPVFTCAEEIVPAVNGIVPGRCIDDELIRREFSRDETLMAFFGPARRPPDGSGFHDASVGDVLKDKGQRPRCGCVVSKDIGIYNTCGHRCAYCYANSSPLRSLEAGNPAGGRADSIGGQ